MAKVGKIYIQAIKKSRRPCVRVGEKEGVSGEGRWWVKNGRRDEGLEEEDTGKGLDKGGDKEGRCETEALEEEREVWMMERRGMQGI